MIRIKVCGLTDPANIGEVVKAGADLVGFIFYEGSKRFIGDKPRSSLFTGIPQHVRKVGVFVNARSERVKEKVKEFGLNAVQLHGEETVGYCEALQSAGIEIIKAFGMAGNFDFGRLQPYMEVCDYFMFDTKTPQYGGSGVKFKWEMMQKYVRDKPFFLSGGIGPEDTAEIRDFSHQAFYGADINSRFESSAGMKDIGKVRSFIQEIKNNRV
jgi:phosphoribosylanthranilate isomerase